MKYKEICDQMNAAGWISHEISACNTNYGEGPTLYHTIRKTRTFEEFTLGRTAPPFRDNTAVPARLSYKDREGPHSDPVLIDSAVGFILRKSTTDLGKPRREIGFLSDMPKSHLAYSPSPRQSLSVSILLDETKKPIVYPEGICKQVTSDVYERNAIARRKCIEHHGCHCSVCGFDFERVYGNIGRGFIHVHHITPLSAIREEQSIDPVVGLRPICPNCHAMIHRGSELLTIRALRALIRHKRYHFPYPND